MLTEANVEQLINAVSQNAAGLSESWTQCFDLPQSLVPGDSGPWDAGAVPDGVQGAGLVALFELGGQGVAVLIPGALPLPGWYQSPNKSQQARMETLSMEWSMNLFPSDWEPSRFATIPVSDLLGFIQDCAPLDWAATLALRVLGADGTDAGSLLMVWPLAAPQFEVEASVATPAGSVSPATGTAPVMAAAPDPLHRLRGLPVQVSVRLAEKKITVSQLLTIANGSLITFPKSCEALLELYVNNARYCRGEAVKIGENFGLKINDVGTTEERKSKILN